MKFNTRKILLIALLCTSYSFSQCFVKIESGDEHTLAIADDGTLWAWGSNTSGECGILPSQHITTPTQVGTDTDWADIDCGSYHSVALKSNGAFYTWGYNSNGQCGTGNTSNVYSPNFVGNGFVEIAAGGATSFAILNDGTLWACGYNSGKFGNGTSTNSTTFVQVGTGTDWVDIETGLYHSLAIKGVQNLLYTSGANNGGQLGSGNTTNSNSWTNYVSGAYEKLGAGTNYSFALTASGTLHSFGRNNYGQLGNGDNTFQMDVTAPSSSIYLNSMGTLQDFNCGPDNVIAVNTLGTVFSWGRAQYNLSGVGLSNHNWEPYYWNVTWGTPTAVGMGLYMASVCTDEGTWTWGKNDRGQLGQGNTTNNTTPTANSASCADACAITDVTIDNVSACDPATNSYTITITTTFTDPGSGDELLIGGFGMPNVTFPITTSPQTVVVTKDFDDATSTSNNLSVSITSSTDLNFSCIYPGITGAWTSPAECGTAGVNELSMAMYIFPNPTSDKLNIELTGASTLIISDINGKQLLNSESSNKHEINVSRLENGVYFIQAENGAVQKFIKQ